MLSTGLNQITRRVYLYENVRYSPLSGWSSKSLLPTDRKAYSNRDGSEGYSSLAEANTALLGKGWVWDADSTDWQVDKIPQDIDSDGYSFAVNFGDFANSANSDSEASAIAAASTSVNEVDGNTSVITAISLANYRIGGNPIKGSLHFVKRRRVWRMLTFDVTSLVDISNFACDHCDLKEVYKISDLLLNKLVQASIIRHPRSISERKLIALKDEMIDVLCVPDSVSVALLPPPPSSSAVVVGETAAVKTSALHRATRYSLESITEALDKFITSCRTTLSLASSVLQSSDTADVFNTRLQYVDKKFFQHDEREELARVLLRKFDDALDFHCSVRNCGAMCVFAIENCPNAGCLVQFSRKWSSEHDHICPEKVISCTRECGENILRKNLQPHLASYCILRPVECPYRCIGCLAPLLFKDLEGHIIYDTNAHMSLMLTRMMEQQQVISSVHQRVWDIEAKNQAQSREIKALEAALAASTAALAALEVRTNRSIQHEINSLENKLNKSTASMAFDIATLKKAVGVK